jgi:hypothetical protein
MTISQSQLLAIARSGAAEILIGYTRHGGDIAVVNVEYEHYSP